MHLLQKGFIKQYLYWYAYEEPYISHEVMIEMMVGQLLVLAKCMELKMIIYRNLYKIIVMDAMRINQGHTGQYVIIDE